MSEPTGTTPLSALYAAVPAAEEEDLLEELAHDRVVARARAEVPWAFDDDEPGPEPPEEPDEELPPLPQVLGLLEHRLGARRLPD